MQIIFNGTFALADNRARHRAAGSSRKKNKVLALGINAGVRNLGVSLIFMDNLPLPKQSPKSILSIFGNKHTWLMTWILMLASIIVVLLGLKAHSFAMFFAAFMLLFLTTGFVNGASRAPMDRIVVFAKYFKGKYITGSGDAERLFGRVEFFY